MKVVRRVGFRYVYLCDRLMAIGINCKLQGLSDRALNPISDYRQGQEFYIPPLTVSG